jgi:hypothetical protein
VDDEEANDVDVPEDNNAEETTGDVAPEETTEEASVDDETYNEDESGSIFGNISSYYVYYGGFGLIVLVGAICVVCGKKRDGYTEIAP